ncbi:hypothetical protein HCN44_009049 [Aphidius gifuensis]|uniref:Uncharacterized protein n=1 Tax=Aphidius gifuensis TaxID=684658 RepID=A0A834XZZ3_APHGI|nr:hypothetical protein HCN44_009049 [Aphidius gifuensis]
MATSTQGQRTTTSSSMFTQLEQRLDNLQQMMLGCMKEIKEIKKLKPFFHNLKKNKNEDTKKSKSFTKGEIEKFLNEAPDEQWLDVKVVMIFGFHGYCRRQELHGLLTSDIIMRL